MAEALKPRLVAEEYHLRTVRGSEEKIIDHRDTFGLKIDLDETDDKSPSYTFAIFDAAGAQQSVAHVDGVRARTKVVALDIAGGTLKPGTYTLRVDGTEAGVATYRFILR